MLMNRLIRCFAALVVLGTIGTFSRAAQAQDPGAIIDAASEAIENTPGLVGRIILSGEGSEMIKSTLPSLSGRFTFGPHPEHGMMIHMIGQFVPRPNEAPITFDISRDRSRLVWVDHEKRALNIRPLTTSARSRPTVFNYMTVVAMLDEPSLSSIREGAESIELEAQQSVHGTLCNVVSMTYARGSSTRPHNKERWYFGASDNLPRRIEQITDAGMVKASIVVEFPDLAQRQVSANDLDVFAQESYTISDTTKRSNPTTRAPQPTTRPEPRPTRPAAPVKKNAPAYSLVTSDGATISNESQSGRVTMIAFGGSWCIPCKALLPELSSIADSSESLDVVYAALRESDPQAVSEAHQSDGSTHKLATNPDPSIVSGFKVRIYPTIVVIGPDGVIEFEGHITRDIDPKGLAEKAAAKANELLAKTNP